HRIPRVDDEVDDRLLQLSRVRVHGAQLGSELGLQLDVLANETDEHAVQVSNHRVQVEDARLEHLLPAEHEQLARESRGSLGGLFNFLDVQASLGALVEAVEQQSGRSEHRRQQVVELSRDAAGQSSHRLHLLRLPVLDLESSYVGEVGR